MESNNLEANLANQHDILRSRLNQQGLRLTGPRQKILDLFIMTPDGEHLSAEDIHCQVTTKGEKISYSTIYRALHMMVDLGIMREVELAEGRKYYELKTSLAKQHHHLVCVQCGEVHEFEDHRVTKASRQETLGHGFLLRDCQFTVYGICQTCQLSAL